MIDSYSFGSITVDGKKYTGDLIIFPERINGEWRRKKGHLLSLEDMEEVLDYGPEMLVVGTGAMGLMKVDDTVRDKLESMNVETVIKKTGEAVQEYNRLHGHKNMVFAAHLTC